VTPTLAVHAPLAVTLPLAIIMGVGLALYWLGLGRADVSVSRRWIRRVSIVFMLVSLPMLVRGLSVVDSKASPGAYIATWTTAILMIVLVMFTAVLDAANNMRIHRRMRQQVVDGAVQRLVKEMSDRKAAASGLPAPDQTEEPS
jgi:hypothetical protein